MDVNSTRPTSKTPMNLSSRLSKILPELSNYGYLSRTFDTKQLNNTINKFKKEKYRFNLNPESISYIENKVRIGESSSPTITVSRANADSPDPMETELKKLHRPDLRKKFVLKLPKLPYGKHESYNGEDKFIDKYIWDQSKLTREATCQVNKIQRKFKSVQKYKPHTLSPERGSKKLSAFEDFHVFNSKAGQVICAIQRDVLKAYDAQTNKYSQLPKSSISLHTKFLKSIKKHSRSSSSKNIFEVSPADLSPTKYDDKYKPLFTTDYLAMHPCHSKVH
jgi:hypothetical protein